MATADQIQRLATPHLTYRHTLKGTPAKRKGARTPSHRGAANDLRRHGLVVDGGRTRAGEEARLLTAAGLAAAAIDLDREPEEMGSMPKSAGRSGAARPMTVNETVIAPIRPRPDLDLLDGEPAEALAAAQAAVHAPGSIGTPGTGAIGADLDLTLIDTRAATAHALHAVNDRCGEAIDVATFVARLGPPIRQELARWVPPHRIPRAVEVFRECFVEEGIDHLEPLPGALELVAAVAARGRRFVVVTSRVPRVAQAALTNCGIEASAVAGGVTGVDKAPAISSHRVAVYLGDHELDMEAAQHASVPGSGWLPARTRPRRCCGRVPPGWSTISPRQRSWLAGDTTEGVRRRPAGGGGHRRDGGAGEVEKINFPLAAGTNTLLYVAFCRRGPGPCSVSARGMR